ncbi:xanthine dehydrogenase family protein molybdopterin-binding subunit [Elioraea rosea]|uniref:xanthine dehydrogenase family protein molybdopterin-binding subunit n=1 Tax=Elioraea rosea TaxID=2492390 RepID=UPI001181EB43|nr:molybdopterin cofactor-binding domain-containing protein [Elioraea rosea]
MDGTPGTLPRRGLLAAGAALVVAFSLRNEAEAQEKPVPTSGPRPVPLGRAESFLAFHRDGRVEVFTGKVDLGTGIRIAIMQMVADELDLPLSRVSLIEGDTDLTPDQGPTWGSLSIQVAGAAIRQAAATARHHLLARASAHLGVPAANLIVLDGNVHPRVGGASVSFAELLGDAPLALAVDREAPRKRAADYQVVGKSIPRPDVPGKVTGTHTYMQDLRLPGMIHARIVFPPAVGARLVSLDEGSVRGIPGVLRVLRRESFIAILAEDEWAAIRGHDTLRAEWTRWEGLPEQAKLYETLRAGPFAKTDTAGAKGDAAAALGTSARRFEATYDFAMQSHASMGPSCAVAQWDGRRMTVWSATQATHWTRLEVARMLGLEQPQVRVLYLDGAGCYGRNGHEDAAAQAALIAHILAGTELAGRPIRVQWMRADEHGWDPKGPPTLIALKAGLDASGNIAAWSSEYWIPQTTELAPIENLALSFAGIAQKTVINPGNIHNNAVPGYEIPNHLATLHRLTEPPLRASWIRSPGRMQNAYAIEAFMDELAHAAGADPVAYRLRHLKDERGAAVLRAAAEKAGWREGQAAQGPKDDAILRGRGVAYARYEARTYIACVAEVEVERASGKIRVTRCVVGHDCGQVINPDGLANQIEGQVVQTVSRTLIEEVTFDRSRVTSLDWASYPILTFPDVPKVEIASIERQDEPPWGAGEMAAVVIPPAVSNAVFDATGVRMRSIPYTPEKVRAALAGRA